MTSGHLILQSVNLLRERNIQPINQNLIFY